MALFFDDIHLQDSNAMDTKRAAMEFLTSMVPGDRVAVFTASGRLEQPFNSDGDKLTAVIQQIVPHPIGTQSAFADYPLLTYYQAYQIAESILPGHRVIVMVSPGFFVAPMTREENDLIDRATQSGVVVNSLDARGVYTAGVDDASSSESITPLTVEFRAEEETVMQDVLASIAYSSLKVGLASKTNCTLEARRGYFAPQASDNPDHIAYQEIDWALTSQDDLRELPLQCETQILKSANQARLTVVARIDTKSLKFRRVDDLNHDNLKVVMALFDNNGNFLLATERGITLQLKDTRWPHSTKPVFA